MRRVKRGWMKLRVERIFAETHDCKTLFMVDAEEGGRPYDFNAGQYLTFRFDNIAEKPIVRSYTMSGSPKQTEQTIFTVKKVPGGIISNYLCDQVKEGDVLVARGPIGRFCFEPERGDRGDLFMVAAGSGVTPFISIIREFQDKLGKENCPKSLNLLVAYRSEEDLISWQEIQEARKFPGVNIRVTLTRQAKASDDFWIGRPDIAMLEKFFAGRYDNATVMTCGPKEFMAQVVTHAKERGVPENLAKQEAFD